MTAGGFINQQRAQLARVLSKNAQAAQFVSLGLKATGRESLDVLHSRLIEQAPVVDDGAFITRLKELIKLSQVPRFELLCQPKLVCEGRAFAYAGTAPDNILPMTAEQLAAMEAARHRFLTQLAKTHKLKANGPVFHLADNLFFEREQGAYVGSVAALMPTVQPRFASRTKFVPPYGKILQVGRTRAHQLFAYVEELSRLGKNVKVMMANAPSLTSLSFLLAQREASTVSLAKLCPNLKVLVTDGAHPGPLKHELNLFLGALDVKQAAFRAEPTGLVATSTGQNDPEVMSLVPDAGTFYEFIPVDDLDAAGQLKREHRRLHAGRVEAGEQYLLLVSNISGLLSYRTEHIVKVESVDPLYIRFMRENEVLNQFGERLSEDIIGPLLAEFNEAIAGYGFFVRDYMVADGMEERCPLWVMEISRPLSEVNPKVLKSLANRLHDELGKASRHYLRAFTHGGVFPPLITFVPVGTFEGLPISLPRIHLDLSRDGRIVKHVLARAKSNKISMRSAAL